MSRSLDFEIWLCFTLPKLLNLSAAKRRNMEIFFHKFADYIRILESTDPKTFNLFIDEFQKRMQKVAKRQPRKPYSREIRDAFKKNGYVFSKNGYKIIKRPKPKAFGGVVKRRHTSKRSIPK